MKAKKYGAFFVLALNLLAIGAASAAPTVQYSCTDSQSGETVTLNLTQNGTSETDIAEVILGEPDHLELFGKVIDDSPHYSRIPVIHLDIEAKTDESVSGVALSTEIQLSSYNTLSNYSGTLTLNDKSDHTIKTLSLSCTPVESHAPVPTHSTLPLPPHHCGRCAF